MKPSDSKQAEHSPPPHRKLCRDCGVDTIDRGAWNYYMVHNDLWDVAGVNRDMLCLGCFAHRLGRPLEASDFTLAPINNTNPLISALRRAREADRD